VCIARNAIFRPDSRVRSEASSPRSQCWSTTPRAFYKRSKPWAEINDENCLRPGCHETRLLEGRVAFKQGIIFDHKPHLTQLRLGKKLRCTSCHSQIVQGQHISVTTSTCFLCHFKGDDTGKMSQCTKCHDAPVRTADKPDVPFDHTRMLAKKVSCNRCHGSMMIGSGDVPKERCNSAMPNWVRSIATTIPHSSTTITLPSARLTARPATRRSFTNQSRARSWLSRAAKTATLVSIRCRSISLPAKAAKASNRTPAPCSSRD